jgi:hypothetical protein
LLLLVVAITGFQLVDRYSPYFVMGRLERATGLLERLATVDSSIDNDSQDLQELRTAIVRQVRAEVEPSPVVGLFSGGQAAAAFVAKFMAGLVAWLLFGLAYLPNVRKDPNAWNVLIAFVFLGLLWGVAGSMLIPDDWATWKPLTAYAIGNFGFTVALVLFWQARQKRRLSKGS